MSTDAGPALAAREAAAVDRVVESIARAGATLTGAVRRRLALRFGAELPGLPDPVEGSPTGVVATEARVQGGWVPTVGPASPPNALTLVPSEHEAMHDLHGALYLSVEGMADLDADRGLHRTQMEFVAARTSLLNECFF